MCEHCGNDLGHGHSHEHGHDHDGHSHEHGHPRHTVRRVYAGPAVLSARGLTCAYPGGNGNGNGHGPVLDGLDFDLYPGQRIGLYGPNGCGKTTLLAALMGLVTPQSGQVRHLDRPVATPEDWRLLRLGVGLVLQQADDQILFPTVLDDVAFGPLNMGLSPGEARVAALEALAFLGLSGFEDRLTHRLSGGEKKLVTLAGVLAMKPKALLLDEPSASLDPATRDRLAEALLGLEVATLVVSHDWDFLERTSREYWTIRQGRLVRDEAPVVHHHAHAHPAAGPHVHTLMKNG